MTGREWKPGDVASVTRTGASGPDPIRIPAVIDPENREQVERLAAIFCEYPSSGWVDDMQAALREYANPKPPEPTDWLAVVEDHIGVQWYRWSVRPSDRDRAWISAMDDGRRHPTGWDEIAVVRVLSPGYTPEDES